MKPYFLLCLTLLFLSPLALATDPKTDSKSDLSQYRLEQLEKRFEKLEQDQKATYADFRQGEEQWRDRIDFFIMIASACLAVVLAILALFGIKGAMSRHGIMEEYLDLKKDLEATVKEVKAKLKDESERIDELVTKTHKKLDDAIELENKVKALNESLSKRPDQKITEQEKKDFQTLSQKVEQKSAENRSADDWVLLGWRDLNTDRFDQALEKFENALKVNPENPRAYFAIGYLYQEKLNKPAEALEAYNQAIALDPNYALAYNNRGNLKDELGDPDGAMEDYNQAISLDPNYALTYINRGILKNAKEDLDGAMEDYNQGIALDPKNAAAYNNRGILKQIQRDLGGAMEDYNQAIALNRNYADAYNSRGALKYLQGDYKGAAADFRRACELEPSADNLLNLAEFLICQGQGGEARKRLALAKEVGLNGPFTKIHPFLEVLLEIVEGQPNQKAQDELTKRLIEDRGQQAMIWRFDELRAWMPKSSLTPDQKKAVADLIAQMEDFKATYKPS